MPKVTGFYPQYLPGLTGPILSQALIKEGQDSGKQFRIKALVVLTVPPSQGNFCFNRDPLDTYMPPSTAISREGIPCCPSTYNGVANALLRLCARRPKTATNGASFTSVPCRPHRGGEGNDRARLLGVYEN